MRRRPSKPAEPQEIDLTIGDSLSFSEMRRAMQAFEKAYPEGKLMIEALEGCSHYATIIFRAPAASYERYVRQLEDYQEELVDYKKWQQSNKHSITKWKAEEKRQVAARKLDKTKARLLKELETVNARRAKI
jgi:hypothetical protein